MHRVDDDPHALALELRRRISDLEYELQNRDNELRALRTVAASGVSTDTRQALKFDVLQDVKRATYKVFALWASVCTILGTAGGFIGYEAIKRSFFDQLPLNELKSELVAAAKAEMRAIGPASDRVKEVERQIRNLQRDADQSQRAVGRLTQSMATVQSDTASIVDALSPDARIRFENLSMVRRLQDFGVTPELLAAVIRRERPLFEIAEAGETELRDVVTWLQSEYHLRPDGAIGPATALVVLALALDHNRTAVQSGVRDSRFLREGRRNDLSMTYHDRRALQRLVADPDAHIGPALREVIGMLGQDQALLY